MSKLTFCGDVWLPSGSFVTIPPLLSEGLVPNLEAPLTSGGTPADGKICLASSPEAFKKAFVSPLLAVCLANNHIMDYGEEGFAETLGHLDGWNIPYFGAGRLENNCNNPLIVNVEGCKVALMGYVCPSTHPIFAKVTGSGVVPIDLARIAEDVRRATESGAQKIVVCLHWGAEDVWLPKPEDIDMAVGIINMGADLVVGHHAHCRQPVMKVVSGGRERYVFFSLGNAYFPDFEYAHPDGQISWKQQRIWNKTAVWVTYSPKDGQVTWDVYREKNNRFVQVNHLLGRGDEWIWGACKGNLGRYHKLFVRSRRCATARNILSRFLSKPKLPSMSSLRYAFKSMVS